MQDCRRFLRCVLGVSAMCVLMLGAATDVAFAQASPVADVWNFSGGVDGGSPYDGLIQASDGDFYGTTSRGGPFAAGTVFKVTATGVPTTLHSFGGGIDGAYPNGGLLQAGGNFYGTASQGGLTDNGIVFKIDASGTLTTLHSFLGVDGKTPTASLILASDGNFYGTTYAGGPIGSGTIFKMDASGVLTTLHTFSGGDGDTPIAGLIQGADGNFYGTTYFGGAFGDGTIFRMNAAGTLTTLHAFSNTADGGHPYGGLIQAADGSFYGTTTGGGPANLGTVFRMDSVGTVTILHSFVGGAEGALPNAGLIRATDASFYGTTTHGGAADVGTVFKISAAGALTTLIAFNSSNGAYPFASLVQASDGSFYGTTTAGGASGAGVVFSVPLTPAGSPTVTVGPDQVVTANNIGQATVTVTGHGSNFGALSLLWAGPGASGNPAATTESMTVTLGLGNYSYTLTVTDAYGRTASATTHVTVQLPSSGSGPQGPPGPAGSAGPAGPQGPQGPKGDTGATGATGPQAVKGDKGATGAIGAAGAQGVSGNVPAGTTVLLAVGTPAPAGYSFIGTTVIRISPSDEHDRDGDHGQTVKFNVFRKN
jgi:uncharacterized repeat protein (TIGR03803 family)